MGINLAVQDAAAAARLLAGSFRTGGPTSSELARVRRRRLLPTVLTQGLQRLVQERFLTRVLAGDPSLGTPRLLRLFARAPVLQGARMVGLGILPERVRSPAVVPRPDGASRPAARSQP